MWQCRWHPVANLPLASFTPVDNFYRRCHPGQCKSQKVLVTGVNNISGKLTIVVMQSWWTLSCEYRKFWRENNWKCAKGFSGAMGKYKSHRDSVPLSRTENEENHGYHSKLILIREEFNSFLGRKYYMRQLNLYKKDGEFKKLEPKWNLRSVLFILHNFGTYCSFQQCLSAHLNCIFLFCPVCNIHENLCELPILTQP